MSDHFKQMNISNLNVPPLIGLMKLLDFQNDKKMVMQKKISLLIFFVTVIFSIQAQKPIGDNWLETDVPVEDAICFALYTVNNNTLKMTAQLYPLDDGVDRVVQLHIK